jgi:hypothetical protein
VITKDELPQDSAGTPILSARALGVLIHVIFTGANISAEGLAKSLKEGERAIGSALRELVAAGYIETKRSQLPAGYWVTSSKVTQSGYVYVNELFIKLDPGGTHGINLLWALPPGYKAGLPTLLPATIYHSPAVKPEDLDDSSRNPRKSKSSRRGDQTRYVEMQEKKVTRRFQARETKEKKNWTPTDVSFEFSDRLQQHWHIKPWRVTKSRFTPTLADNRRRFETDGEIECIMIDLFMETEEISKLSDPDQIAGRFIYRFSELATRARLMLPGMDEERRRDVEEARREWEKF